MALSVPRMLNSNFSSLVVVQYELGYENSGVISMLW